MCECTANIRCPVIKLQDNLPFVLTDSDVPPQIDLAFAVDSSSWVGKLNFLRQLYFVKKMVQEFSVSLSGTRVALVSYATAPKTIFGLTKNVNKECTVEALTMAKYEK